MRVHLSIHSIGYPSGIRTLKTHSSGHSSGLCRFQVVLVSRFAIFSSGFELSQVGPKLGPSGCQEVGIQVSTVHLSGSFLSTDEREVLLVKIFRTRNSFKKAVTL